MWCNHGVFLRRNHSRKPTVAIIGCGQTGKLLIETLIGRWYLLVIEKDPNSISDFVQQYIYKEEHISFLYGDATSYYFLNQIDIAHAYEVLVCVGDDNLALEIISLLKDRFQMTSIIAKINNPSIGSSLQNQGITVVYPSIIACNYIVNSMKTGENIAAHVGIGEGEILQIQLTSSSPLIYKPLRTLPRQDWIIGAVYRPHNRDSYLNKLTISKSDTFIIPHGDTSLEPGDKILLIGDPTVLKNSAQYLKSGFPIFPNRYGSVTVFSSIESSSALSVIKECSFLLKNISTSDFIFFYKNKFRLENFFNKNGINSNKSILELVFTNNWNLVKELKNIFKENQVGIFIYTKSIPFLYKIYEQYFVFPKIIKLLKKYNIPLWLSKPHIKIKSVTILLFNDINSLKSLELAIDVADKFNLPLKIIQIIPSIILMGPKNLQAYTNILKSARELKTLYNIESEEIVCYGNPISETLKRVSTSELLVFAYRIKKDGYLLAPHIMKNIQKKFLGSQLVFYH